MSQDLLYSILPRAINNPISKDKTGIKKIDKIPKKGIVDEEHTTLSEELPSPLNKSSVEEGKKSPPKNGDSLDTYA